MEDSQDIFYNYSVRVSLSVAIQICGFGFLVFSIDFVRIFKHFLDFYNRNKFLGLEPSTPQISSWIYSCIAYHPHKAALGSIIV